MQLATIAKKIMFLYQGKNRGHKGVGQSILEVNTLTLEERHVPI